MKISLASDLHLEFEDYDIQNTDNTDVLILAGDIMLGERPKLDFLERAAAQWKHIIYVAGNHEYYRGNFYSTRTELRKVSAQYNIHFLENESVVIDDITFIGCTLWTDCNKGDPVTMHDLSYSMNDYRVIRDDALGYTKLKPNTTRTAHYNSIEYIMRRAKAADKPFVITHHLPHPLSVPPQFKDDYHMNGGYQSNLDHMMSPHIPFWVHGHTHDPCDYTINGTRIIANPKGYPKERSNYQLRTIECLQDAS